MKNMLAIGLAAALGVTGLAWSALGQQQGQDFRNFYDSNQAAGQPSQYQGLFSNGHFPGLHGAGETENLARQLAKAKTEDDREKIRAKLSEQLEKQFDERQKKHKKESEDLEAQVKKLKELISNRNENRKEIISRRLDQIVREAQGLGW